MKYHLYIFFINVELLCCLFLSLLMKCVNFFISLFYPFLHDACLQSFFQNFDCDVSPSIHSSPRSASLSEVSENEFQSLPSYLRQMSLNSLNQTVHNINNFMAEYQGQCYICAQGHG